MIPVESAAKDPSAIRTSILGDRWIADFHALISVTRPGTKQTIALKIKIPNSIPSIDGQVLPEIMWIPIQIIAGIVTILTVSELYKRANLFISVGQITLIYIVSYFAFFVIHEGSIDTLNWETFFLEHKKRDDLADTFLMNVYKIQN